jgi:phosphatidylglycerophosphatase A
MLASVFFLGYVPLISGTVGSAAMVACLWWLTNYKHMALTPLVMWFIGCGLTAFSTLVASRPKEVFGADDPKQVVIDECAGQFVTFLFVPLTFKTLLLGFVLFRLFDIVKPYPVYKFEALDGGLGITMDDIIAGVLANIVLISGSWAFHAVKAML